MDATLAAALDHARSQDNCLTLAECEKIGLSRKRVAWLVRHGHWIRLHHGVYLAASGVPSWRQRARAALLHAGPGAALSHESAAFARGLTTIAPRIIEVSVPATRRAKSGGGVRVIRRDPMPPSYGRLRAVAAEHTVLDLLDRAETVDDAIGVITRAYRARVPPGALREVLASRSRVRRRRLVADLLVEASAGIESPLERRYHHDVEISHGLPAAQLQVRAVLGGQWTRADRRYSAFGVRVELDGQLAHPDGRTDRDTWRDNAALVELHDLTLRYRWSHVVTMSCETAAQVVLALRRGGWTGTPRRCGPSCRLPSS